MAQKANRQRSWSGCCYRGFRGASPHCMLPCLFCPPSLCPRIYTFLPFGFLIALHAFSSTSEHLCNYNLYICPWRAFRNANPLQVTDLLPELGMTTLQLTSNLRIWYDRYTAEVGASAVKTAAEKEAEKVDCHLNTENGLMPKAQTQAPLLQIIRCINVYHS